MKHTLLIRLLELSIMGAVLVSVSIGITHATRALAANNMSVTGYAWSSNIGWISFNGTASGIPYGVQENKTTRSLSGYAWSSNIGWISFQSSDFTHSAPTVNKTTGVITGYARACAAFANKNSCSGALDSNSGGWDGWIALSGTASNGATYGWKQAANCQWSGYAWGSDSIGAISVNGSQYGVKGTEISSCLLLPTAIVTVTPLIINSGQAVNVNWSSTNTTSCTVAQGNFSTGGKTSGTVSTGPLSVNALYQTSCTGPGGNIKSNIQSVIVRVPTASLNANPDRVVKGKPVTLNWNATNVKSCTITKNGILLKTLTANAGTVSGTATNTVNTQTIYKLTCVNGFNISAISIKIVNVVTNFNEF